MRQNKSSLCCSFLSQPFTIQIKRSVFVFPFLMASNHILTLFVLLFSSWFFVGLCEIKHDTLAQGGSTEGNDAAGACVSKLIPCQAYLNATSKPPAECCVPLKEAIANEIECLCKLFANRDLLRDMNVTQEQVLKLPKACGAHAKLSVCKTGFYSDLLLFLLNLIRI